MIAILTTSQNWEEKKPMHIVQTTKTTFKHVISYFINKIKSWHVLSRKSTQKFKNIVMLINVDLYSKIGHDHLNSWPTSQNQTC
jgi:hypothetical protein